VQEEPARNAWIGYLRVEWISRAAYRAMGRPFFVRMQMMVIEQPVFTAKKKQSKKPDDSLECSA
jgi:hypothetical protein